MLVSGHSSIRSSAGLPGPLRWVLVWLRSLAFAALFVLLFNPGDWKHPDQKSTMSWVLLSDVSSSMKQATADGSSRAAVAAAMADKARKHAADIGVPLRVYPFAATLEPSVDALPPIDGNASCILPAVSQALQDASASGDALAGIVVVSDGRETLSFDQAKLDALGLRARSRQLAVHTVAIGTDVPSSDLALIQPRNMLTAFAGQPLRVGFAIKSTGLQPSRPTVVLRDSSGAELASRTLELGEGQLVADVFEVPCPPASCQWTIETPVIDGEVRSSNNQSSLNIRVLESKTRIFLVEGAPYWDSKFLAQLLRQQAHVDIRSVHKITDERYFRIESGSDANQESTHPVFPDTLAELERYDLIIFGKNVDAFLTPDRVDILRAYVRDHGGAVLFSRGKPTSAEVVGLEPLEPVAWSVANAADFRFVPNRDGEVSGLFGQALPDASSTLWSSLPTLKDGRQVMMVKPFARVLADGVIEQSLQPGGQSAGRFPALVVRRYGQGVTGLVNGDGLWRWDFYPEARGLGNCYEDFWIQLIQWMASYSEFLPGQDFSLKLSSLRCEPGATLAATVSYRGPSPAPQPIVRVTGPGGITQDLNPAAIQDPGGRMMWRATHVPTQPGEWNFKLIDPRPSAPATPEALLTVPFPPAENDDLSPDAGLMKVLATATGGEALEAASFDQFLQSKVINLGDAIWDPAWDSVLAAIAIAALLTIEWILRRRHGLA